MEFILEIKKDINIVLLFVVTMANVLSFFLGADKETFIVYLLQVQSRRFPYLSTNLLYF